jgi:hypothetical protein
MADLHYIVVSVFKKWLGIVSIAIMYNYIFIVGRAVFWDMQNMCPIVWLVLDYLCDVIYMLDMIVHAHEGVFYHLTLNKAMIK